MGGSLVTERVEPSKQPNSLPSAPVWWGCLCWAQSTRSAAHTDVPCEVVGIKKPQCALPWLERGHRARSNGIGQRASQGKGQI